MASHESLLSLLVKGTFYLIRFTSAFRKFFCRASWSVANVRWSTYTTLQRRLPARPEKHKYRSCGKRFQMTSSNGAPSSKSEASKDTEEKDESMTFFCHFLNTFVFYCTLPLFVFCLGALYVLQYCEHGTHRRIRLPAAIIYAELKVTSEFLPLIFCFYSLK